MAVYQPHNPNDCPKSRNLSPVQPKPYCADCDASISLNAKAVRCPCPACTGVTGPRRFGA